MESSWARHSLFSVLSISVHVLASRMQCPSLALAWAAAPSARLLCQLSVFVCSCERVGNCERSLRESLGPGDTIGKGLGSETVDFNKATDSK